MAINTQNINTKSVAKYVLLPGIIPRAKALGSSGFGYLAFLFARIYGSVRILPATHPFMDPANIGQFGLLDVLRSAANNLEFKWKNIDKIFVYFALITGLMVMVLQFALFFLAVFSGHAFAGTGGAPFISMFVTEHPETDIAFLMLDYVFGLPNAGAGGGTNSFFGSNALVATGGPTPFHQGLHALINFYNLAILLVGVLIFLYYIVVVVIETAQTGVPFGKRFAKLYAPFRLIFAVGLLVPLNYGFNGAQYITLYAAKLGSSFATNGWILYNHAINGAAQGNGAANTDGSANPLGTPNASVLAKPRAPSIDEMAYFSSVFHACREIYNIWTPKQGITNTKGKCIKAYVIVNGTAQLFAESGSSSCAKAGATDATTTTTDGVTGGNATGKTAATYEYKTAKTDFGKSDMEVVLGELDTTQYKTDPGGVHPYCGKITISLNNDNPALFQNSGAGSDAAASTTAGVERIEEAYYNTVRDMLSDTTGTLSAMGEREAHSNTPTEVTGTHDSCWKSGVLNDAATCKSQPNPPTSSLAAQIYKYRTNMIIVIDEAYTQLRNGLNLQLTTELENRGWGGAGIWYNHIADMNGTFTSAIYSAPTVSKYPEVMEFVKETRRTENKSDTPCDLFSPNLGNNKTISYKALGDDVIEKATNEAYRYFACSTPSQENGEGATAPKNITAAAGAATAGANTASPPCVAEDQVALANGTTGKGKSGNPIVDVMAVIFGINGLFDIRSASCIVGQGQPQVHPLAQLATVGRSLIENAIRSMAMAVGAAFGGGMAGMLSSTLGASADSASAMFVSIATIGLTAGFVLYYVLPFLPFIYFFFAVGSWVKSIFEAMVGVPLWALAHLHIDGEGLPGRAAMPGYYLIFEIFLRPIVTVFGLIGGLAVFTAMAIMLNNIFDLVVLNATGAPPGQSTGTMGGGAIATFRRGVVDRFFFTIMYTVLLYMMATASFKMIDMVPNNVMRWIGSGVSVFNDNKGDVAANLTSYVAAGGANVGGQAMQGVTQGARAVGGLSGSLIKNMIGDGKKN